MVNGTKNGLVTVWNAQSYEKVTEFTRHRNYVRAVDVSPDTTKIPAGSSDETACIWSRERLGPLGTFKHDSFVMDVSSRLLRGTLFESTTVKATACSSTSQFGSAQYSTIPLPGRAILSNSSSYLSIASSSVSMRPLGFRSRNGPFTPR